ncbi:MAG: 16S rRNA (guanine(966)-N(2))-methyltransferase RsmD [Deltaproteobacteria bacterium]|nr:16S rRNA (guanine(966)-N(2))-methyltransferase RsmD [Deltaproteobacteria bacterium]
MRIIAGEHKGRTLKTTEGPGYRPAMGKVRGALFSMLEARGVFWPECRVLDLFAGSGSLGFEALSRGAAEVCFVESNPAAAALIRENAIRLGLAPRRWSVLAEEARRVLTRATPERGAASGRLSYDLVFIDPPYGQRLLASSIRAVLGNGWLREGGILHAETESRSELDPELENPALEVLCERKYGQTRILLWRMKTKEASSIPALSIPSPTATSA